MADGFRKLARAAQIFDEQLKTAFVGMVPCSDVGELECGLEKWEKVVNSKINEVKLFNSKAILVNASLQKGCLPNLDVDGNMAQESLGKSLDGRLRWGKFLQVLAITKSVEYISRENPESAVMVKDLLSKLLANQRYLDKLEQLEQERESELQTVTEEWHQTVVDLAQIQEKHLTKENKRTEKVDEELEPLLDKMEVMRQITLRLAVSNQGYDWTRDPSKRVPLLPALRNETYTPETFL